LPGTSGGDFAELQQSGLAALLGLASLIEAVPESPVLDVADIAPPRPAWPGPLLTRRMTVTVVSMGIAGVVLALAGVQSPLRAVLVLLFLAAAPAVAVAGLLRGLDRLARLVVADTASIVINALVAETMLAAGVWPPRGSLVVVALITAACAALQRPAVRDPLGQRLASWRAAVERAVGRRMTRASAPDGW
jgi:hypothetical protein